MTEEVKLEDLSKHRAYFSKSEHNFFQIAFQQSGMMLNL